ncbi:MAG: hypothetical protein K2W95_18055 [Candidatus Obscuribacterales bacterium]|nr:hypothetical protein [Candidatus Obscuribacterales bacterium]
MATMTKIIGYDQQEVGASANDAPVQTEPKKCSGRYSLLAFLVPFATVTVMYTLSNAPICEFRVVPCCLTGGLLAGTSGYLLYKGIKFVKHLIHPH